MAQVNVKGRSQWETLSDYILQAASRDDKLLQYRPRAVGVDTVARQDVLVVDDVQTARFSALLAEALLQMSEDTHEPGDRATTDGGISYAEAVVLVRKHDGVRPAARATGLSKDALWRALRQKEAA